MTGQHDPEPPKCHSQRDGDCDWKTCPQLVDYKSYCPLATAWEAWCDRNGHDYR